MSVPSKEQHHSSFHVAKILYKLNCDFEPHKAVFQHKHKAKLKQYLVLLDRFYMEAKRKFKDKAEAKKFTYSNQSDLLPHNHCEFVLENIKRSETKVSAVVLFDWDDTLFPTTRYGTLGDIDKNITRCATAKSIKLLMERLNSLGVASIICTARTKDYAPIDCLDVLQAPGCAGIIYTANMIPKEYFRLKIKEYFTRQSADCPVLLVDDQIYEIACVSEADKNCIFFPIEKSGECEYIFQQTKQKLKAHGVAVRKRATSRRSDGNGSPIHSKGVYCLDTICEEGHLKIS